MKTLTLAHIYELQGHKEDAVAIYRDILKADPTNKEALSAVRRLSGLHKKYAGLNTQMKEFFVSMQSDVEMREFERWLLKLWN